VTPPPERRHERFALRLAVVLVVGGNATRLEHGTTRDLSLDGVFVHTELELPADTSLEVRLIPPPGSRDPVIVRGRVRRVEKHGPYVTGLGIQFDELRPEQVSALTDLLRATPR
jgi:hypothetical protein